MNNLSSWAVWRLRLLLALLLLFGSEILLWTDPTQRNIANWLPLALGYVAVACVLLELAIRFRARGVFGLLALAGIYGLLNGLLLNPETALADMPRTLFTRVMGAHTLVSLLTLTLYLHLVTPRRLSLLPSFIVGVGVGLGWGTWARWSPTLLRPEASDTPLTTMLVICTMFVAIIVILARLKPLEAVSDLRLKPLEWFAVVAILVLALGVRGLNQQVDTLTLLLIVILVAYCVALLYFLRRKKGETLLDDAGNGQPSWMPLAAGAVVFVVAAFVSYGLPRGEGSQDPVFLITTVFTAFGLVWLPGVSLAIGAQAFARQVRAGKL